MVIEGTYEEAVKMMGDIAFLGSLTNFPKECINDETVELLQPYFNAPDFNFESAKKVRPSLQLTYSHRTGQITGSLCSISFEGKH